MQDMTRLSYLHEPAVLSNLKTRYAVDDIYTYTGTILIAINPFASLPHLYGPHMMDQYRGVDLGEIAPHVYAIADSAYRQMRKEMRGQSILVRPNPAQWHSYGMILMEIALHTHGRQASRVSTALLQLARAAPCHVHTWWQKL